MQLAPSFASQGKGWTWAWLCLGFEFCGLMEGPCYLDCWSSWEITQTTKWMQDGLFLSAHSNVPGEGVMLLPATTSRLSTFLLWVSLSLGEHSSRMSFSGTSVAHLYHLLSLSCISGPPLDPWNVSQISEPLLPMQGTECSSIPWTHPEMDSDSCHFTNKTANWHILYRRPEPLEFTCGHTLPPLQPHEEFTLSLLLTKRLVSLWIALSFCPWWGNAWKWGAPGKAHCYSSAVIVTAQLSSFLSHVSHTSLPPVPIRFKWKMLRTIRQAKNETAVSPGRTTACSCCSWFTLISPLGPFDTSHTPTGRIRAADEAWTMKRFSVLFPSPLLQTP